jgi:hypothetical protein
LVHAILLSLLPPAHHLRQDTLVLFPKLLINPEHIVHDRLELAYSLFKTSAVSLQLLLKIKLLLVHDWLKLRGWLRSLEHITYLLVRQSYVLLRRLHLLF